jgi:hypothetical protein
MGNAERPSVQFGVPALCLIEAATGADDHARAMLTILTEHADATPLPLDGADWRQVAAAAELLGNVPRACAALPVAQGRVPLTRHPHSPAGHNTRGTVTSTGRNSGAPDTPDLRANLARSGRSTNW